MAGLSMRVLFLSWRDLSHPLAGGSEVLVDQLARGLMARGHQAELVCAEPAEPRAYPVTAIGGTYSHFLRVPARYLRHYRGLDLVVDVANGVPYFSPVWRRRPCLCLVNHVHTEHWARWFPPPLAAIGRNLEAWALPTVYRHRLFVAVSSSTASSLVGLGVPADHIRIVHNGIEGHDAPPEKSPEPLFLGVGRLVPNKRYDILLRLWETVRPLTGGRLVLVGEGPERDRLRSMAGADVSLPGWVCEEEKQHLMESAWLLLHPSAVEGWGLVVLEAATRETPTVGFDVAGLRDSVVDGRTGALARSEEEFAKAWVDLARDRAAREELGRRARERAAGFSWSTTVDRFLEVAREAVSTQAETRR